MTQFNETDKNNKAVQLQHNLKFYYGYKECQKKGIKYTYPNPNLHNNAP